MSPADTNAKPWANWHRSTVVLADEPGITLEELYQAFKARMLHESLEPGMNKLSPAEREIAERMGDGG